MGSDGAPDDTGGVTSALDVKVMARLGVVAAPDIGKVGDADTGTCFVSVVCAADGGPT